MAAEPTFIFAGGGTGGHLYPSLAIAERVRSQRPGARFLFLCSDRPIDRRVLEPEGVEFRPLPAKPIGVRPRTLWRFARNWPASVRQTRAAIRETRAGGGAVHLVALGGFVAAPAVQAARVEGVPVTLVNIDAAPGKANRWIARRCGPGSAFTTYASPEHPHWRLVNPIVRGAAASVGDQRACRKELGLDPEAPVLMVTGGSLGAGSVNALMAALAARDAAAFRGWQVIHQCGDGAAEDLVGAYGSAGVRAVVAPFTRQMGLWWGSATLAVARAGAGSVAEAWCNRVPCVFLPYPYHHDDHQRKNAESLASRGAALLYRDHADTAKNLAEAGEGIARLLRNPVELGALREASAGLPPADGAATVAAFLLRDAV